MDPMNEELPGRLADAMRALDARSHRQSAQVSPDRVAGRVLERLRHEGMVETRVWWLRPAALRVAAAAVLLVAAGWTVNVVRRHSVETAVRLPVSIPVDSLSAGQLEAVLQAAGEVHAANFGPVTPSNGWLDSLSEQQLQKVLASL
ncbi:MAG TPA: hypothetical protein VMT21_07765 [Gemmatimonadales bacterium]|nr:hypothetical protein [Gemmatimonadales bacterium]